MADLFGMINQGIASIERTMAGQVQSAVAGYTSVNLSSVAASLTKSIGSTGVSQYINPLIYSVLQSGQVMTDKLLSSTLNNFANNTINYPYATQLGSTPGLANQTGRYVFSAPIVNSYLSNDALEYSGYTPDVAGEVAPEYIILVKNTRNWIIRGVMQEAFVMGVDSSWAPIVPQSVSFMVNYVSQFVTGSALVAKWATRRIWTGTSPIRMKVELVFNAVANEYSEVVRPCLRLQQMALPYIPSGRTGLQNAIPLMNPPGPSPFAETEAARQSIFNATVAGSEVFIGSGDKITIRIGKFLEFVNVVVRDVQVSYSNKMTQGGFPVSSKATITFETYEMMDVDSLEAAHIRKG